MLRQSATLFATLLLLSQGLACSSLNRWALRRVAPHAAAASAALQRGRCDEVIQELQISLDQNEAPTMQGAIRLELGECKIVQKDFVGAAQDLQLVADQFPKFAFLANASLAILAYQRGDVDGMGEKLSLVEQAASSDDERAQAAAGLAFYRILVDTRELSSARKFGNCDEARRLAREIVSTYPRAGDLDLISAGPFVQYVRPGGAAALGGIAEGDEIVSIDGAKISDTSEMHGANRALRDRYRAVVPIEIVRRPLPGDSADQRQLLLPAGLVDADHQGSSRAPGTAAPSSWRGRRRLERSA